MLNSLDAYRAFDPSWFHDERVAGASSRLQSSVPSPRGIT
jgi:hypothetical protein